MVAVGVLSLVVATAASATPAPGASGIGDPYYPLYGNGGYDVSHYDVSVAYSPGSDRLSGTTTITATATQDLSAFDLDLALRASSVTVDGRPARFQQGPHELVVTPARAVRSGRPLTVVVRYAGIPSQTSVDGFDPWVRTADGAVAVGEPEIAAWWFPSNDHPRDKATFDITVTVPHGVEALSNGILRSKTTSVATDTWSWRESSPMATYLAFMAVGQFDVRSGTSASGLPWVTAVASNGGREGRFAAADLARTPEIIDWHTRQWGPYPFDVTGGVAPAADFGFALENQTR
ncbi:MAG: M1 family peptidase, partial [Lapillicoccus sp.]